MNDNKQIIIGITGTLGAGKGTVVDYLKTKGFKHYSVRNFLMEEIKKRNLPINRDSMVIVANDLREKKYPGYIVECLYQKAKENYDNAIIESIRNLGEIETLKNKGNFYLFAVDADPKIRYSRIVGRKSETDKISFEKFLEDEKKEINNTEAHTQNLSACIKKADFLLDNNTTLDDLHIQIEKILEKIIAD